MRRLIPLASLALAMQACAPTPATIVSEPPAPPPTHPASTAEPSPPDPPKPWTPVLEIVAVQLPDNYVKSQGQRVTGIATPWAEATAHSLGLDVDSVAATLDIIDETPGRLPVILTSAQHGGSSWTYVTSDTARIHQITPVGGDTIAILAAHQPPDAQIIDVFEAQWILALHHVDHRALTLTLDTRIPDAVTGLWDVLTTSLDVHDDRLRATVEFAHSGGGDACEQRFEFFVRVELEPGPPRLVLDRVDHHQGICAATGHGERS